MVTVMCIVVVVLQCFAVFAVRFCAPAPRSVVCCEGSCLRPPDSSGRSSERVPPAPAEPPSPRPSRCRSPSADDSTRSSHAHCLHATTPAATQRSNSQYVEEHQNKPHYAFWNSVNVLPLLDPAFAPSVFPPADTVN